MVDCGNPQGFGLDKPNKYWLENTQQRRGLLKSSKGGLHPAKAWIVEIHKDLT